MRNNAGAVQSQTTAVVQHRIAGRGLTWFVLVFLSIYLRFVKLIRPYKTWINVFGDEDSSSSLD